MSIVIDLFVRMRRSFFVFMVALTAGGCSALLGLEERGIDDGFADDNEGGRPDRRVDTLDGEENGGDGTKPTGKDAGGDVALIPCLLQDDGSTSQAPAFFCDDFETVAMKPEWTLLRDGGGAQVSSILALKDGGPKDTKAISGTRAMTSGFDSPTSPRTPASGDAIARYQPAIQGPLAVRFSFNLREESDWPSGTFPIASVVMSDDQEIHVVFIPNGTGPMGSLALDVPGNSISLGPIIPYNWLCIEIVSDGSKLEVFSANLARGNAVLGKTIKAVDLGYKWRGGSNEGSRFNDYENVIISPARVGCNP